MYFCHDPHAQQLQNFSLYLEDKLVYSSKRTLLTRCVRADIIRLDFDASHIAAAERSLTDIYNLLNASSQNRHLDNMAELQKYQSRV